MLHYKKLLNNREEVLKRLLCCLGTEAFFIFRIAVVAVLRGIFFMTDLSGLSNSTRFVHAGERRNAPAGTPAATPIYATSSFIFGRVEDIDRIVEGEVSDYVYSRYGNPTVAAFEEAMAAVENGTFAYAYGSGMAALHAALLACELQTGSVVLASRDLYGSTFELLYTILVLLALKR